MQKKNKLSGGIIFIENNLTWEERKIQREISVWVKQQRAKEKRIKIGYGKIRVNGEWKYWNDIVKEIGKEDKKRDSVRVEERGNEETNGRGKDRGDGETEEDRVESSYFA